nr:WAS/WASL-interacting protein family member 2-like [Aegilops tauschii subsp. strangulata]
MPAGVIASVPDRPTGVSSDPQPPPPPQAFRNAPPSQPPTSLCHHDYRTTLTASLEPSTRDLEMERRHRPRERTQLDRREGTASTAAAEPTGRGDKDLPGHAGPAGLTGPEQSCHHVAARRPTESSPPETAATTPPPGNVAAERRATGPPQPRWAPNGPRSGLGGRRPTANGRTAASRATGPAAPPPTGRTEAGRGAPPPATTV